MLACCTHTHTQTRGVCVCVLACACAGEHAMALHRRCLLLFIHQCINSPFLLPVRCWDRRGRVLAGNFHSSEWRCAFYCYVVCVCVAGVSWIYRGREKNEMRKKKTQKPWMPPMLCIPPPKKFWFNFNKGAKVPCGHFLFDIQTYF